MKWILGSDAREGGVPSNLLPAIDNDRDGGVPLPPHILPSAASLAHWEGEICQCYSRHQKFTLDLAKIVSAAKKALLRGQWTQLWKSAGRLPFAIRKGEMLAAVGENLGNLNAHMCARLPVGWTVLYQVARLPRPVLEKLIADKVVHPDITWSAANALAAKFNPARMRRSCRSNVKRRLRGFTDFIRGSAPDWTEAERSTVCETLRELAGELTTGADTEIHSPSRILTASPDSLKTGLQLHSLRPGSMLT